MKTPLHSFCAKLILFMAFLLGSSMLQAQQITIKGLITESKSSKALAGVTVVQSDTNNQVVSDSKGEYQISMPGKAKLVFTCPGYLALHVKVKKGAKLNVSLEKTGSMLHDQVEIGYGSQEKMDKTGAVDKVTSSDLNTGDLTSPIQSLQGKIAGVTVSKTGGDPNSSFAVHVRGSVTFDPNTQPFYVIDGIPNANPTLLSPDDIESVSVLKDASSAAIYGVSGANGVIIITTKNRNVASTTEGGTQKPFLDVEFNSQFSMEKAAKKLDLMTASQMRDYAGVLLAKARIINPDITLDSVFHDGGASTDWQKQIYRTRYSTRNRISISTGNKHGSLLASFSRNDMNGTMEGTARHQTTGHLNGFYNAWKDRLTIGLSLMGSVENNEYQQYNGWGEEDVLYQAYSRNPTDPVYDANGSDYNNYSRVFQYVNPQSIIDQIKNTGKSGHFIGGLNAGVKIVKGLTACINAGFSHDDIHYHYYRPAGFYMSSDHADEHTYTQQNEQKMLEVTGKYSASLNDLHNIDVLAGYSWQEEFLKYEELNFNVQSSWPEISKRIGMFARAQYNFDLRYFISASLRRDGNSKFGKDNQWGFFPAVSLGWNIANEKFLKSVKWLDQVKLRVGYGVTGNDKLGNTHDDLYYPGLGDGPGITGVSAGYHDYQYDKYNLKWEETTEVNAGLDFALLHQRVSGSLEVYTRQKRDILMEVYLPVPPNPTPYLYTNSMGFSGKGIEFTLRVLAMDRKAFSWSSFLTVAHNRTILESWDANTVSPVTKYGYISGRGIVGDEQYVTGLIPGEEVGAFYLPRYAKLSNGEFVYIRKNGGYTINITDAERYVVGSPSPKVELGWTNEIKLFKRWDLAFSFRCWLGNKIYNATRMFFDSPDYLPSLNTLTSATDWAEQGRLSGPEIADFYAEDASFLKLDRVTLSYDFDLSKLKWIKQLNLFFTANNVLTITGYKGIDPESNLCGFASGIDQYNVYTPSRSFTLGLKALF
jgi:iron complex outermembrane receptor protein